MSRRSNILVIITLIVIGIAIVVGYFLRKTPSQTPSADTTPPLASEGAQTQTPGAGNPPVANSAVTPFAAIEATARSFAERWGSFSTESDFQNVRDVYPVMTDSMRSWAERYVAQEREKQRGGEFFGVTTRAMNAEILSEADGVIRVAVTTQREETKGASAPRRYYQTMEVALVKNGAGYMVDGAWWK